MFNRIYSEVSTFTSLYTSNVITKGLLSDDPSTIDRCESVEVNSEGEDVCVQSKNFIVTINVQDVDDNVPRMAGCNQLLNDPEDTCIPPNYRGYIVPDSKSGTVSCEFL